MATRDYNLLGEDGKRAVSSGLAAAEWYHTEVPRRDMKLMMRRADHPAIRDTLLLFSLMILFAVLGLWLWPTVWSVPFWLAYGVLYGSAMDSRWHECGHGTAFKTAWMNDVVYQIASFMMVRNPVTWRWSHARHHTDTAIVGRDPEIVATRPPSVVKLLLAFVGVVDAINGWRSMLLNAFGNLDAQEETFIPESEQRKVVLVARIWCAIYALTLLTALNMQSLLPLMLVGLPRLYGAWHHVLTGILQHGGLADNVTDHRLNSRTVYMNLISRFIYWNMNYHVEHHMFPMVPYHQLPALHERIKHDLPQPNTSMWEAYVQEIIPVLKRQLHDPEHHLVKVLPPDAKPYRADLNGLNLVSTG